MSAETDSEVTYAAPWRPQDDVHQNSQTLTDFCEEHRLIPEFLPFNYIKCDVLRDMISIHRFLNTRLVTKQIIGSKVISKEKDLSYSQHPTGMKFLDSTALLIGWWDVDYRSVNGTHYGNPNYVHTHDRYAVPKEDHAEFFKKAARLGIDYTTIAPALGVDSKQPRKSCHYRAQAAGVDYAPLKRQGWMDLIRTWKTIRSWGHSYHKIGQAFNRPPKTVWNRVGEHAADFDPPDEPSIVRHQ